jgi:hypothetical protein
MALRRSTGAVLIVALALAGTWARTETSEKGLLRVTATWGDDRFVPGWASETVVSSDGRHVAVSTVGGVIIWDVNGGTEVRIPMPASSYRTAQLAFGPGDRVLVTARDGAIWRGGRGNGRKPGREAGRIERRPLRSRRARPSCRCGSSTKARQSHRDRDAQRRACATFGLRLSGRAI